MVLERMRNPSIYLEEPLRQLVAESVPDMRFDELRRRLLVNTVDLARGTQVVWGLRGLRDVSIADAVYASCALPGFFPPGVVGDRLCVDGGVLDNLPVAIAARGMDAVIAVDVGSTQLTPRHDVATQGFAAIYMRAATTMMHELQLEPLREWGGPPMILIRPDLGDVDWFDFTRTDALIEMGYAAAKEALRDFASHVSSAGGIFPKRRYRLTVSAACVGCSLCAALAPDVMGMSGSGHAFPETPVVEWSPADGDFVRQCPTGAITATPVEKGEQSAQQQP
jgi:NTE family protein